MAHPGGRPPKEIRIDPAAVPADKVYLTVPEICAITGYDPDTIHDALRAERIKGKKLGNRWRVYRSSVVYDKVAPDLNTEK